MAGAGPVGCVAALAFARAGARVLLLEANPAARRRLAGEWLHPRALDVLRRVGVEPPAEIGSAGRGFAVFPDDGTEPILLPYAEERAGLICEHAALVSSLRAAAAAHLDVRLLPGARVAGLNGERLTFHEAGGPARSVLVERVVGADGRASLVRRQLGVPGGSTVVSRMAGVVLEGAELPFEGFGHVLLGGPGPVLVYRIGPDRLRACLDVPGTPPRPRDAAGFLWDAYGPVFPKGLVPAFWRALRDRPVQWAANQVRTRGRAAHYGRGPAALVGDAVGHYHPLTAVGIALGLDDAECLPRAGGVDGYRRERAPRSRVPELLAGLLYEAFTRRDDGTVVLRRAMYEMWRRDPLERGRTMRLLAGDETGMLVFSQSFLKVLGYAVERVAADAVLRREWRPTARSLGGLGWWLRRLNQP